MHSVLWLGFPLASDSWECILLVYTPPFSCFAAIPLLLWVGSDLFLVPSKSSVSVVGSCSEHLSVTKAPYLSFLFTEQSHGICVLESTICRIVMRTLDTVVAVDVVAPGMAALPKADARCTFGGLSCRVIGKRSGLLPLPDLPPGCNKLGRIPPSVDLPGPL